MATVADMQEHLKGIRIEIGQEKTDFNAAKIAIGGFLDKILEAEKAANPSGNVQFGGKRRRRTKRKGRKGKKSRKH
jgi:hypothetical protein